VLVHGQGKEAGGKGFCRTVHRDRLRLILPVPLIAGRDSHRQLRKCLVGEIQFPVHSPTAVKNIQRVRADQILALFLRRFSIQGGLIRLLLEKPADDRGEVIIFDRQLTFSHMYSFLTIPA
jgi:hypothetical protein